MSAVKRLISPIKYQSDMANKKLKISDGIDLIETSKTEEENFDFLFNDDDDFDFAELDAAASKKTQGPPELNLRDWQRCVVEHVERMQRTFDLVLQVREESAAANKENDIANLSAIAKCHLQGPWSHTRVATGDVVSLQAVWDPQLAAFKVDKDNGFCVTNPDTLIPVTSVVGSLFCRRKAVLQDQFKGIDATSKVMVIGSLVHEMLQTVLAKSFRTRKQIENVTKDLLDSQELAFTLYESMLTREEVASELQRFVPNILSFVEQYLDGKEPQVIPKDTFQGKITEIQDIEENLWIPRLGLKGKVDVSVKIKRRGNALQFDALKRNAIPLELKTGRASFSMEHKGQILLYQMMLTMSGRETTSGLLLYLREGLMREIRAARNEQRDLIVLRNDLGHYLASQKPTPPLPPNGEELGAGADRKFAQPLELPEPISHHSACGNCEYATLCCTFAKTDAELELSAGHPLQKVMTERTSHLKNTDYAYFMHWCGLLALEDQEARKSNYMRSLWTDPPETRQRQGRAIIDLNLNGKEIAFEDSRYLHTFELSPAASVEEVEFDLTLSGFDEGEYVIVSASRRLAVAAGFVQKLTQRTISISLERDLRKIYPGETFIVDKNDSKSANVFNYTNLGVLLENTERASSLRAIIVEREQPTFSKGLPKVIATEGAAILRQLNAVQRSAVLKALTTESFMLIKGLPGTGKTQTLVAIVRMLCLMGKSVIITSHTHSAVDNLLLRLKPHGLPMLRLGSGARINSQLREITESVVMKDVRSESKLAEKYASFNVVGVTCLGAAHALFLHRKFDYCIVDEATQVMQPTVLRPLFYCEKFVLVGDPDQLPPLIRSKEARLRGADVSLFQRLDTEAATSVLTLQYRMNKTIMRLANELTYGGALQCASDDVKVAAMKTQIAPAFVAEKWLQRTLQTHVDQSVFLLDTLDCADRSFSFASAKHSRTCAALEQTFAEESMPPTQTSPARQRTKRLSKYTNYCDAAIVFRILKALLAAGYDPERIGVIAPYRAQVELLRKLTAQHQTHYQAQQDPPLNFAQVEVNTVDQYQGRDKDIVLYSCAKTGAATGRDLERSREAEILEDKRRLTVAITRSKHKLILVGDAACLAQYSPFQALLGSIPGFCKLKLEEGKQGFSWQPILEELSQVIATQT